MKGWVGVRIGSLVVIAPAAPSGSGRPMWLCRCDRGNEVTVRLDSVQEDRTQSCGCLNRTIKDAFAEAVNLATGDVYRARGAKSFVAQTGAPEYHIGDVLSGKRRTTNGFAFREIPS